MAAPGTPFEAQRACPFVALELDRDRRSDKPDYRHRCFAEPTPAPRSIAHQEAYCLSPNFAACPIFQDWAVRAAARPAEPNGSSAAAGAAAPDGLAAGAALVDDDRSVADVDQETAPPTGDSALEELPEDASVTPAGAEIAAAAAAATGLSPGFASSPPTFATTDWQSEAHESEQLGVFDAPPQSSYGQPDTGYPEATEEPIAEPTPAQPPPAFVPPPSRPEPPTPPAEEAAAAVAAPAFLAGRSSRPQAETSSAASGAPPRPAPYVSRDDLVPSWELDGRYGAEPPPNQSGGGSRLDGILTAIAVIAILALGVAAVLFLPGILNKSTPPKTPLPSFVIPSGLPGTAPSSVATVPPTIGPSVAPTVAPTLQASQGPVGSPRLYKIKTGDSLARIANKFGVTVQQILDANPDITDPNSIFVGQIIVIPTAAPPS